MSDPVARFLAEAGWADAERAPLAGDASNRAYQRVRDGDGRGAVLMIAPPERGEDTRPFVAVAEHLRRLGLSAPEIYAGDTEHGLLLIEDLGDDLFARIARDRPEIEPPVYDAAVDVLVHLHRTPPPDFAAGYDRAMLVERAELARIWYARHDQDSAFSAEIDTLFAETGDREEVLALRDYHAENLLWLPDRNGVARVGLLDFQDALRGHRAYDLVSLVEDARRDLAPGLANRLVDRYVRESGVEGDAFTRAMALYGAQRNLRILGVFARLARRDGKPGYLKLIPRVWGHLMHDLSHPALQRLRTLVDRKSVV